MKKITPGVLLSVIWLPEDADCLAGVMMKHTTTPGIQYDRRIKYLPPSLRRLYQSAEYFMIVSRIGGKVTVQVSRSIRPKHSPLPDTALLSHQSTGRFLALACAV